MTTGNQVVTSLRSLWWIPLIQGIVALVIGFALFGQPVKTLAFLTLWLGVFWVADGVLHLSRALVGPSGSGRGWLLFVGIVEIIGAIMIFAKPVAAGAAVVSIGVAFLAAAFIVGGLALIFGSRSIVGPSWASVLLGILYVVGGILLLVNPSISAVTLLSLFAVLAIITGILYIVFAFQVRNLGQ